MSTSNIVSMSRVPDREQPSFKEVGSFIDYLRRIVRRTNTAINRDLEEAKGIRAEVLTLKAADNPFNAARIGKLEQRADKLDAHRSTLSASVRECGYMLADAAPQIDAATTLAERSELLNVTADRAGLTDADGVKTILFVHALEDSAERRHCGFNDGPLFNALSRVMMDFLDTPQGQAASESLYEPGGMFEWARCYKKCPDGTGRRVPPRLRGARPSDAESLVDGG
jgi:hypothetical protein